MSEPAREFELPTAFFSYARADAAIVRAFADQLRAYDINVLLDTEFLRPGEQFERTIMDKVRLADALVFFVSPASLRSTWVEAELVAYSAQSNKLIVPVLIGGARFQDLPPELAEYQGVLAEDPALIPAAAEQVAVTLRERVEVQWRSAVPVLWAEAEQQSAELAASIAAGIRAPAHEAPAARSVFLVHGTTVSSATR